jgi:hypothetical protein
MTTPLSSPSIVLTGLSLVVVPVLVAGTVISGRQQVGEDAFQRLVGG